MSGKNWQEIQIGKYRIVISNDFGLMIYTDDEGGQFNMEAFEAVIDKFYKENF